MPFEIRRGLNWNTGEVVGRTLGTSFVTFRIPYNNSGKFWVAPYSRAGVYTNDPLSVSATGIQDYMPDIFNEDQAAAPAWNGTKSNCSVTAGILNCNDSTATYTTTAYDTGAQRFYRLSVELGLLPNDGGDLTWDEATFTWDSDQAARRMWNGWAGNPINKGPTVWSNATNTWDSWFGNYMTWAGPLDFSNRTAVVVEWSGSLDNVSYTDYVRLTNEGEITSYRYYKFKVTMTGDAAAETHPQRIALSSMKCRISRGRVFSSGNATSSTGGTTAITWEFTYPSGVAPTCGGRLLIGGDAIAFSSITSTGANVDIYNAAGSRVAKTFYWNTY